MEEKVSVSEDMSEFKRRVFQKMLNEKVLSVQAEYSTSPKDREYLADKLDEVNLNELTNSIMKEIKPHITVTTRDINYSPSGILDIPDKVHSAKVFFMSEESYLWLLSEIDRLFDNKERKLL